MPSRRRFFAIAARATAGLVLGPALARGQERARAIHRATRNTPMGAVGVRLRRLLGRPERAHDHPGRERLPLGPLSRTPALSVPEALDRYAPAPGFRETELPRATLERLLHFTNGVTGESPAGIRLRAAPSAGALYAGEVYVVATRVEGLAPGVYAYTPLEEALVPLSPGEHGSQGARALEQPARARGAAAAVLFTNVFARYRWRYANRGYRYALIDSGHLGENLRLAATSAGVAERSALRFRDDLLNRLLGVDGVEEAVCAVHLLGAADPEPEAGERQPLAEAHRLDAPLPEAADDAPERYHAATRLVPATSGKASAPAPDPSDPAPAAEDRRDGGAGIRLPEPRRPEVSVERAIEVRRSTRRFLDEAVAPRDLAFVLEAATGHPALRRVPGVELRLVVHRVEDLAPGLYGVASGGRRLRPLRTEPLADALVSACLGQEKAGSAAVGIAAVADLAGAGRARGDRAYRDLCLEAGGMAQRVYLAAEALGLSARNLAAFVDDRLNALVGVDGRRRAVVHLTMLGAGD